MDLVYAYTRKQAIEDGVLINLEMANEAGWKVPVAITAQAYAEAIQWDEEDTKYTGKIQDTKGRTWDCLYMAFMGAKLHIRRQERGDDVDPSRFTFRLYRVPRIGGSAILELDCMVHPGDEGECVATIMLPWED